MVSFALVLLTQNPHLLASCAFGPWPQLLLKVKVKTTKISEKHWFSYLSTLQKLEMGTVFEEWGMLLWASFSSVLISFPGASTDQSQIQFQIQRHAFNWPAEQVFWRAKNFHISFHKCIQHHAISWEQCLGNYPVVCINLNRLYSQGKICDLSKHSKYFRV